MAASGSKLLVINSGSSSLKFKLFQMATGVDSSGLTAIASGICERVGEPASSTLKAEAISSGGSRSEVMLQQSLTDHTSALAAVSAFLNTHFSSAFAADVHSVGHRVVHGLAHSEPALITDEVLATIEAASDLAPLHNPPNLMGIRAAAQIFPAAAQVAVFDTAFHQTMPPEAFMYALPYELYQQRAVRRYGFHGTSYRYLSDRTAAALGKLPSQLNAVLCHLGAGASMCAVRGGRSIDTTMGLTPLEGLVMGTRCGDIDPAIVPYLVSKGMSAAEVDTLMNKRSGFLGLTGFVDLRQVLQGAASGDDRCALAVSVFVHRCRKYLGAYWAHLEGSVDAVVFSAGIGEHSAEMRRRICSGMAWAGVKVDAARNEAAAGKGAVEIQAAGSAVKVVVVPTDEELSIAEQTLEVVAAAGGGAGQAARGA